MAVPPPRRASKAMVMMPAEIVSTPSIAPVVKVSPMMTPLVAAISRGATPRISG